MNNRRCQRICAAILIVLLSACGTTTPPREFAPNGKVVKKAIALQLNQAEQGLSAQLKASQPQLKINRITVKTIEPLYVAQLPTYHLQGTYNLTINLPRQQVTQKNRFDIYLQRQAEGKTWRLLKRETSRTGTLSWISYLILLLRSDYA